jgi:hypothetical protein
MKNVLNKFFIFYLFQVLLGIHVSFASNCDLPHNALNKLLGDTVNIRRARPEVVVEDKTRPIVNPVPVVVSRKFQVSTLFTDIDPTPRLSPPDKLHELYLTSFVGKKASVPQGYQFNAPLSTDLTVTDFIDYLKSLRAEAQSTLDGEHFVYINSGGLNNVYLKHSNPLPASIKPGSQEHIDWAIANGENLSVKKVPKELDEASLRNMADVRSRDDAFYQLADDLTQRTFLDNKKFIRVAKGNVMAGEQEFIQGPTVLDLRKALDVYSLPANQTLKNVNLTRDEALQILTDAGFFKNGKIDIHDLDKKLMAVETFYKQTHAVARNLGDNYFSGTVLSNKYRKINDYSPPLKSTASLKANPQFSPADQPLQSVKVVQPEQEWGAIGFDFNHGRNVIWSVKEQMFVIIDI